MNKDIIDAVKTLLNKNNDGHGFDHVERVRIIALRFAEQESADKNLVELASLLHDVDDYKIFGSDSAENLINANRILGESKIEDVTKQKVLEIIKTMGYSKSLDGIRPATLEGMIVSDADMCDAIGAEGILRTYAYNASKGNLFFDKSISPKDVDLSASQYRDSNTNHSVQHFFDKLLKISSILMTKSGKDEGAMRQKIMTDFLYEIFREEDANDWELYLKNYLNTLSSQN